MKRKNPYTTLLDEVKTFAFKVKYRAMTSMWTYPKESLPTSSWKLADLDERVRAADQLGFEVLLIGTDKGLEVKYRKRVDVPYQWAS